MRALILLVALTATAQAQWEIQSSGTTASLRGIHALGNGIAWASGTEGTVLHTTDNGAHWLRCTTPPDAEKLDFRGIQAFDATTAIVMSSGKGDLSRLYKTTDACQTWKLLFTNPDPEGFWDAIQVNLRTDFGGQEHGILLGDPVDGEFVIEEVYPDSTMVLPDRFRSAVDRQVRKRMHLAPQDQDGRGAFAASNSSLVLRTASRPQDRPYDCRHSYEWFGTGGPRGAKVFRYEIDATPDDTSKETQTLRQSGKLPPCSDDVGTRWVAVDIPLAGSNASSGVFSLAISANILVAVGGDYTLPNNATGTAAFTIDEGEHWQAATTPPHGYRSAVAYDAPTHTWITVGPNGTDISTDDGRNWRALKPSPGEATDADQHWNALSLPFVVGPHGRIGILKPSALLSPEKRDAKSAK